MLVNLVGSRRKQDIAREIARFLGGGKVDDKIVRKLRERDKESWMIMLQEVEKANTDVRFSKDLILVLDADYGVWHFMERYLKKLVCAVEQREKIPLFDLSEFCGFLRFRRKALHRDWQADRATFPTVANCTKLLIKYVKELGTLQDEGSLTVGKLKDELILFFKALDSIISEHLNKKELDEIRAEARKAGLISQCVLMD
jgi:hypothetical protein